jgi:hypothetical protein
MLTFSEVGNTEAHETKRRTSQPDSGLATIPTRRFWPCLILGGMNTNMGDLDLFCHEVLANPVRGAHTSHYSDRISNNGVWRPFLPGQADGKVQRDVKN